jgi:hypothetical protein
MGFSDFERAGRDGGVSEGGKRALR